MLHISTSIKLYPNGCTATDNTVMVSNEAPPVAPVDYTKLQEAVRAAGCPEDEWVFVRCSMADDGVFQDIEWQLTPFDDERAQKLDKQIRDALIPKKVQDGVRNLRPYGDEAAVENTMSGLYSREEWDAWGDLQYKDDPSVWDREPHVEADTFELARFFNYPCGALVHVLDTDTLYLSTVKPLTGGSKSWSWGFEAGDSVDENTRWSLGYPEEKL